jgi:hypothetical protein
LAPVHLHQTEKRAKKRERGEESAVVGLETQLEKKEDVKHDGQSEDLKVQCRLGQLGVSPFPWLRLRR